MTNIGPSVRRYDLYQTVILVLDIETTGLAQDLNVSFDNIDNWPYVVQISYQIFSGYDNDILKESDYILKPDCFTINLFQVLPLSIEISQKPFASTFSFGVTPAVPASGMALTGLSLTSSSVVMSLMVYAQ